MADIESLRIVFTGDASGLEATINGVERELNSLGKIQSKSVSQTQAMGKSYKEIETRLNQQKEKTLEYTKALRDSSTAFREKQKAVQAAALTYDKNTASLKENLNTLQRQKALVNGNLNSNNSIIKSMQIANKGLGKNSEMYKRNTQTIKQLRTANKDLISQETNICSAISETEQSLAKEEKAYKSAQNAVKSAAREQENMRDALKKSKAAEKEYSDLLSKTSKYDYESIGKSWKEQGEAIDAITKPIQTTALALAAGGVAAAKFAIDFEDNFASVEKTVKGTPEQLKAIKKSIIDMTTVGINGHNPIPMTTEQLTELAAAGGQLGIARENIADFTETIAMLETATNLGGEEGAQTLAKYLTVTKTSQDQVSNLGSAVTYLGNNYATTEADIASMGLRLGRTGQVVNMNAASILGYATALSSMGIEAEAGGSAVSRIWRDIEMATVKGGKQLQMFAEISGKTSKEFTAEWKNNASETFNDFLEGIGKSGNITKTLQKLGFVETRELDALQTLASQTDVVRKAVSEANTEWKKNTALLEEFDTKTDKTKANLMATRNNLVEAARSIGETMLPTINEWSRDTSKLAQNIAGMSDGAKETLVKTTAGIVVLGAASKGVVGTMKTVGSITEAVGKLKKFSSGADAVKGAKGISAIGTALAAIPLPAKLAVAGIAAVGATAAVAYDKWYDSQYRWSEGLSEGNEKIKESLNEYKQISSIQGEIKNLKLVIENPDSSKEQVENAKKRLEEIKQILSEEYNLVIKADNSNLDTAVETVKKISKNDLQYNMNVQQGKLAGLKDRFDSYDEDYAADNAKYEEALAKQTRASNLNLKISELNSELKNGAITLDDYGKKLHESAVEFGYSGEQAGYFVDVLRNGGIHKLSDTVGGSLKLAGEEVEEYDGKLKSLTATHDEYIAISTELANQNVEMIELSALEGDAEQVQKSLESMGLLIKNAGLDMSGYAQAASEAMNGIKLDEAIKKAWEGDGVALNNIIGDYIESMNAFGASAEETAVGAALLKNGFTSIGEAVKKGDLDTVIQQVNDVAHSMNIIPEDKNITITANVDTGGYDIFGTDGEKVGEITADGTLNWKTGEIEKPEEEDTKVTVDADTEPAQTKVNTFVEETNKKTAKIDVDVHYTESGAIPQKKAKGTQSFSGGLAMVNDQEGISDPRELIIDKGRAFIPQGRNVILPLSKGAKVYTASQTKAIMRGLGIPHYAKGKSNSDAFVAAKDNWTHYTSTHAVTVTEELQKWVELSEQFNANEKDRMDIAEKIFDLQRKQTEELNKQSLAYIKDRAALNDWTTHGDDPLAAYDRIKERNRQMLEDGKLTWDEYTENVNEAGEALYDGRISQSEKWLDRELKYGRISQAEYRAGLDRMRAYTQEYYDNKLISHREYVEGMQELDDKYQDSVIDENREKADEAYKKADAFLENRNVYDDWDAWGISEIDFWDGYIDETRKLQKEKIISDEEAWDKITEAERNQFRAREAEVDKMLEDYRAQIDSVNEYYDNLISRKEEARTISDLEEDSADAKRRMAIYEGAVTERGKEAYKQAKEDLENAEHEKEIMRLQQEQNAVIKQMQTAYDEVEKNKKNVAKGMSLGLVNVNGIVKSVNDAISKGDNGVVGLLDQLVKYVCSGKLFNMENYSDNRSVTNYFPSGIDMAALAAVVGKEMR